jgi:hypothetical protein
VLVAWDYLLSAVEYDSAANKWDRLPSLPLSVRECYPSGLSVPSRIIAFYCGQIAVFDANARTWSTIEPQSTVGGTVVMGPPVWDGNRVLSVAGTPDRLRLIALAPKPSTTPVVAPIDWEALDGLEYTATYVQHDGSLIEQPPTLPAGVEHGISVRASDIERHDRYAGHGFTSLNAEGTKALLIKRQVGGSDNEPRWRVVAVIVGTAEDTHHLIFGWSCGIEGVETPHVISLGDFGSVDDATGVVPSTAAWRFDPATEEVTELDPTRVECWLPQDY